MMSGMAVLGGRASDLTSIAPGQHVLRVARSGEADDERVIEIRPDSAEQINSGPV